MTDYFCDRCVGTDGIHEMDCPDYVKPVLTLSSLVNEEMYTVAEVARALRVSKMTVYRLTTETKEMQCLRVGRTVRIPGQAVRNYLAGAA